MGPERCRTLFGVICIGSIIDSDKYSMIDNANEKLS